MAFFSTKNILCILFIFVLKVIATYYIFLPCFFGTSQKELTKNKFKEETAQERNLHLIDIFYSLNIREKLDWCSEIKFFNPPRNFTIALASFPGSGETWLKYLLQQSTGIATGSMTIDPFIFLKGFPGEKIKDGSVSVISIGEPNFVQVQKFTKAILLIRSPMDIFLKNFFHKDNPMEKITEQALKKKIINNRGTDPLHVVFYKQLENNTERVLKELIDFIEIPLNQSLLKCALERKNKYFKPENISTKFSPYSPDNKDKIQDIMDNVVEAVSDIFKW